VRLLVPLFSLRLDAPLPQDLELTCLCTFTGPSSAASSRPVAPSLSTFPPLIRLIASSSRISTPRTPLNIPLSHLDTRTYTAYVPIPLSASSLCTALPSLNPQRPCRSAAKTCPGALPCLAGLFCNDALERLVPELLRRRDSSELAQKMARQAVAEVRRRPGLALLLPLSSLARLRPAHFVSWRPCSA